MDRESLKNPLASRRAVSQPETKSQRGETRELVSPSMASLKKLQDPAAFKKARFNTRLYPLLQSIFFPDK